jgi:RsiW-degrading membrane proteinase PrsW (M82 family)
VFTVVAAAAPSLFLLTFFYLKDRYQREPLNHIIMAFGLGLYSMIAAQGMATTAESLVPPGWLASGGEGPKLVDAFVLSGLVEELAKWVILVTAVCHWEALTGGIAISYPFVFVGG